MMLVDTKKRTAESEIMDDFSLKGEMLRDALDKIAKINRLLGGNQLTLRGVKRLIHGHNSLETITIVDVGCGNGDMLRALAKYAKNHQLSLQLIGIDANEFTINHAQELSKGYQNISYQCEDVFDPAFSQQKYDIALCTLTLHHFKDNEIKQLLNVFKENASIGIVINDLHRSGVSYRLFQLLCFVFDLNEMSREDGLVSILRGFKKKELEHFSTQLNFKKYSLQWKWAFRYEWIINTK